MTVDKKSKSMQKVKAAKTAKLKEVGKQKGKLISSGIEDSTKLKKNGNEKKSNVGKPKGILKKSMDGDKTVDKSIDKEDEVSGEASAAQHTLLLKSIQSLDGRKAPITQRNESAKQSEYHSKGTKKVNFGELLKSINTSDADLKKRLKKQDGSRKLPQPVEKIHMKKAERVVNYKEAKDQLRKWESIVEENRVTPQQQFPLERSHISIPSAKRAAALQQPRTAMELEIQALLRGEEYVSGQHEQEGKPVLSRAEQRTERSMNLASAKEELALRRKHRAMVANIAAKNRRQGKIKSRSYHRHLRVERRKNAFKALEKLKSEDPDLWKEKAEEVEVARIEERATLRHKGKSQFAKLAKRYGKFNEKIKDSLDEMRSKGVELLQKQVESDSDSESEGEEREDVNMDDSDSASEGEDLQTDTRNPWSNTKLKQAAPYKASQPQLNTQALEQHSSSSEEEEEVDVNDEVRDFSQSDKVVVIEPDMSEQLSLDEQQSGMEVEEAIAAAEELAQDADDLMIGESTRRMRSRADVDKFDDEFEGEGHIGQTQVPSSDDEGVPEDASQDVDANKVITIPSTNLMGHARAAPDSSDDEDDEHGQSLAQAFADDGIAEEFAARRKRKYDGEDEAADAEASLQKLPGWGRWSGAGIEDKPKGKMSRWAKERLRKEELRKAAVQAERDIKRSKYPKGVIVNEEALRTQPIAKYQVSRLKSNMTTPAFHALMSHPVGREFIPAVAHNELCKPKVVTAIGTIITPMSKDMVKEKSKSDFPSNTVNVGKKIAQQYDLEPIRKRKRGPNQLAKNLTKT